MSSADEQHSIDVRVDTILGKIEINDDVTIALPTWQWAALGKLAEHNDVSVPKLIERWVRTRLIGMRMGVADPPGGDSPSTK